MKRESQSTMESEKKTDYDITPVQPQQASSFQLNLNEDNYLYPKQDEVEANVTTPTVAAQLVASSSTSQHDHNESSKALLGRIQSIREDLSHMSNLHQQMREKSQLELSQPLSKDKNISNVKDEYHDQSDAYLHQPSLRARSSREHLPEPMTASNLQTAEFNNTMSQRAPTFSPMEKSEQRRLRDSRATEDSDRLLFRAEQKRQSVGLNEQTEEKRTIENDNHASNMLIMNEDLPPLNYTYPFRKATQAVATALEPHMIKETAFSETQITPVPNDSQSNTAKSMRQTKQALTEEPAINTEARFGAPEIIAQSTDEAADLSEVNRVLNAAQSNLPLYALPQQDTNDHKPFSTAKAQDELFLMDSYYKELIKRERAAFERILASKLNVHERDVERRYQKQMKEADNKLQRAEALSNRFKDSQNACKRLMKEVE